MGEDQGHSPSLTRLLPSRSRLLALGLNVVVSVERQEQTKTTAFTLQVGLEPTLFPLPPQPRWTVLPHSPNCPRPYVWYIVRWNLLESPQPILLFFYLLF